MKIELFKKRFAWHPDELIVEPPDSHVAAGWQTFGKPDQQRDYHGRWGKGGSAGAKPLSGSAAYKHISDRQKRITDDAEKYGLGKYVSGMAEGMNRTLRESKGVIPTDSDLKVSIQRTEAAIKNNGVKLEQSVLVHRGARSAEKTFGTKDVKSLEGAEITDHGFMSTSTDAKVGADFRGPGGGVLMNITVPKGHQILGVDKARGGSLEREMLLQRGTTLKVNNVTQDGNAWSIDAEVV